MSKSPPSAKHHYFLDEAGDPSFYGKWKTIVIGQQGVSLYYILGMVKFEGDLDRIRIQVRKLQKSIESNPYYKGVGSIEKKKNLHGYYFHATDDLPEVRKFFFDFIKSLDCSFEAVVAAKIPRLYLEEHNENPREFYGELLSHLLHDKLATASKLVLNIAERGTSTRNDNLDLGLQKAVAKFTNKYPDSIVNSKIVFNVQDQLTEPLLNIADYLCWCVQRKFEKGEERFYEYMSDKIKLVIDLFKTQIAEEKKSPLST